MNILLDHFRENETDTTAFFTLTDGEYVFKWHADIQSIGMSAEDIQKWLDTNCEKLRTAIYRKQYLGISPIKKEGETELQAWQKYAETTIEKPKWKDTH